MEARVPGQSPPRKKRYLFLLCLLEALLLVIICLGFLDFSVHYATRSPIKNYHYSTQPKLKGWDDKRLERKPHETDMEYATRMNMVVGSAFYHCKYYTKENIFEKIAAPFSKTWSQVGFLQPDRNCGFCHQAAYILAKVLNAQGITAYPIGMNGHVCVLMKDGNNEYIFDPDYVVGPMIYQDHMTHYISELYENKQNNKGLHKAFATSTDDRPYYSMKVLNEADAEQARILSIVKGIWYLCIVAFLLNTVLIVIKLRSKK